MGAIKAFANFSNLQKFETFSRFVSYYLDALTDQFNGGIDFQTNIRSSPKTSITFIGSSDVITVPHNLGFVPNGILPIKLNAVATVYAPTGTQYQWTNKNIYLQSSAAVTVTFYII